MILIVGIGNPLRRDDRAGRDAATILGDLLAAQGQSMRVILTQQLAPELAVEIGDLSVEAIWFLDASATAGTLAVEQIRQLDVGATGCAGQSSNPEGFSHQVAPELVLAYASLLRSPLPPAWVVMIPGSDFAHGEGLSEATRRALEAVTPLAAQIAGGDFAG